MFPYSRDFALSSFILSSDICSNGCCATAASGTPGITEKGYMESGRESPATFEGGVGDFLDVEVVFF